MRFAKVIIFSLFFLRVHDACATISRDLIEPQLLKVEQQLKSMQTSKNKRCPMGTNGLKNSDIKRWPAERQEQYAQEIDIFETKIKNRRNAVIEQDAARARTPNILHFQFTSKDSEFVKLMEDKLNFQKQFLENMLL